jgi:hypothetical protein
VLEPGHLLTITTGDDLDVPALVEDAELAPGHVDGHHLAGTGQPDLDPLTSDLELATQGCPAAHHDRPQRDDQDATGQPGAVQPGTGADRHWRGQRPHQHAVGEHVHGGRLQPQRERLPGQRQPNRDLLAGHPDGPGGVDTPVDLDRIARAQQQRVGGPTTWAALGPRPAEHEGQQQTTTDNDAAGQSACRLAARPPRPPLHVRRPPSSVSIEI